MELGTSFPTGLSHTEVSGNLSFERRREKRYPESV